MHKLGIFLIAVFACVATLFPACATVSAGKSGANVDPGYRILKSKCGACHLRPERSDFDEKQWKEILEGHHRRAPMSKEQQSQLLKFLISD
jgi:hypothetical protein